MSLDIIHNTLYTPLIPGLTMATNQSGSVAIQGLSCYAVQSSWAGFNSDASARIVTQGSNDNVNWTQVDSVTPSGTTGSYLLNVEKAGYRFVQVSYTQTSGVGTLTTTISGKII